MDVVRRPRCSSDGVRALSLGAGYCVPLALRAKHYALRRVCSSVTGASAPYVNQGWRGAITGLEPSPPHITMIACGVLTVKSIAEGRLGAIPHVSMVFHP